MGLFNRAKSDKHAPTAPKQASEPKKEAKKEAAAPAAKAAARDTGLAYRALLRPLVTEKTTAMGKNGGYAFKVATDANKIEIKKAVEAVYGVHVDAVRVMRMPGKPVRSRRGAGRRSAWRKALVTLKKGERIDLYANA